MVEPGALLSSLLLLTDTEEPLLYARNFLMCPLAKEKRQSWHAVSSFLILMRRGAEIVPCDVHQITTCWPWSWALIKSPTVTHRNGSTVELLSICTLKCKEFPSCFISHSAENKFQCFLVFNKINLISVP